MTSNLTRPVLVLNSQWNPITAISVRKSIVKVCSGHAYFLNTKDYSIHDFESWLSTGSDENSDVIHVSNGNNVVVPEVIVLKSHVHFKNKKVKLNRRNLLIRDNFRCQYSGNKLSIKNSTIDHVMPRSKGGPHSWGNVVICSVDVNARKADRTPVEAHMKLLSVPKEPKWSPVYSKFSRIAMTSNYPKSWNKFLKGKEAWRPEDYWSNS